MQMMTLYPSWPSLQIGVLLGKTRNALADFNHGETLTSRESDWFLNKALKVRDGLEVVENGADKSLVGNILVTFEKEVLPNYVSYPRI